MALDISIVDQPIRMIMESDIWQIAIAIGTLAVAVSAWITLWKSGKTTQDQLKLTRREFRHKTRPILACYVYTVDLKDPTQFNGDVYTLIEEKALFHFINNGSTTATNIQVKSHIEKKYKRFVTPFLNPNIKKETDQLPDLAPTEFYSVDVRWNKDLFMEAREGKNCYVALLIWYDDEEKNQYYYHMEGHFERSFLFLNYVRTGILKENP